MYLELYPSWVSSSSARCDGIDVLGLEHWKGECAMLLWDHLGDTSRIEH